MTADVGRVTGFTPYVLIATGGFCGSVLHFWINAVLSTLPGTLLVNTAGSVLMGIFMYEMIATGRFGPPL